MATYFLGKFYLELQRKLLFLSGNTLRISFISFIFTVFALNVDFVNLFFYFQNANFLIFFLSARFSVCKFVCLFFNIFFRLSDLSITLDLWTVCPCLHSTSVSMVPLKRSIMP